MGEWVRRVQQQQVCVRVCVCVAARSPISSTVCGVVFDYARLRVCVCVYVCVPLNVCVVSLCHPL